MCIETLESMKSKLMCCVKEQIDQHIDSVNTKQLGQAIDMIKDLSQAVYYCTITESMNESNAIEGQRMYYTPTNNAMSMNEQHMDKYHIYKESKKHNENSSMQLHKLEDYLKEVSSNINHIRENATTEEKAMIHQHMSTLANQSSM